MKNSIVLSLKLFFHIESSLKKAKERVCNFICFIVIIIYLKIVLKHFLSLPDLFGAQTFCIHKITKVVIIDKYEDFMFETF